MNIIEYVKAIGILFCLWLMLQGAFHIQEVISDFGKKK